MEVIYPTQRKSLDCTGLSRRAFLRVGGLSALGLGLPAFLRLRSLTAAEGPRDPKSVNCILLWMQGGPSHHDTFDPKPDAPAEVRGEFNTIPTTLPGVRIAEHLPLLARQTDKFSIIRGHDPKNGSHGVADHLMMTGHPFNASLPYPCFGSVVARERGYRDGMLPFVQLGRHIDRRFNGGIGDPQPLIERQRAELSCSAADEDDAVPFPNAAVEQKADVPLHPGEVELEVGLAEQRRDRDVAAGNALGEAGLIHA